MKRAVHAFVVLALAVSACGLKVPTTLVQGSGNEFGGSGGGQNQATGPNSPGTGPNALSSGPGVTGSGGGQLGGTAAGLFGSETEGLTKNKITICGHVPITGAAPIPHNPERFGQFFFNWVNDSKENGGLGGIFGRKVRFDAFDDGYYPAGARLAIEKCHQEGAFMYFGAAGTDQIVNVAKWAEQNHEPYFHGPTSDKDLANYKYSVATGPNYEWQSRLLADYMVKKFGTGVKYAMIRLNSPFFQSAHDAYVDELKKLGVN
ncbi:MAG: ABC transporter substrate-binding protein, partial [Actinomycetota bacterium]